MHLIDKKSTKHGQNPHQYNTKPSISTQNLGVHIDRYMTIETRGQHLQKKAMGTLIIPVTKNKFPLRRELLLCKLIHSEL